MKDIKEVVEAFKELAEWDETKRAWVYKEDRYSGGHIYIIKHKGDIIEGNNGKGYRTITMDSRHYILHRLVYMAYNNVILDDKTFIDHINGNRLDNSINNLRIATTSQNNANKKKKPNCSSRYKGVCWSKKNEKWLASIKIGKIQKHLGYFTNEIDAAKAYNDAAVAAFGEYAKTSAVQQS